MKTELKKRFTDFRKHRTKRQLRNQILELKREVIHNNNLVEQLLYVLRKKEVLNDEDLKKYSKQISRKKNKNRNRFKKIKELQ